MIIYQAICKETGLSYVGLTTKSLQSRKNSHWKSVIKGSKTTFHLALKKYGLNGFKWKTLEKCETIEELKEREIHYIAELNTYENGYNSTKGGEFFSPNFEKKGYLTHKVYIKRDDIILLNKIYNGDKEKIFNHLFPGLMSNVNIWLSRTIDKELEHSEK